ncbi:MAG: PhzF family phenazine biosynthesis protein [Roseivirga sp.]|nr:PhzF family phenazine biosynthesis protein [Roseivirga sp.]
METFIVDSFTNEAFKGNPAGVCLAAKVLSDELMQSIAIELNLSETAFVQKLPTEGHYSIRYFSPKMEIPLCGHATLASAKVLFKKTNLSEIHFKTVQGLDLFIRQTDGDIVMQFPVYETKPAHAPEALLKALGLDEVRNTVYNDETRILLLEISDSHVLAVLKPDFRALQESHGDIHGVLVTAAGKGDYDFHSRYFWPWSGSDEDPVTGGTHTFLAPYWASRLNKKRMRSFQSSARTGFMEVELLDDQQMLIRGSAVITFEGKFRC